jgi:hypothetical protein
MQTLKAWSTLQRADKSINFPLKRYTRHIVDTSRILITGANIWYSSLNVGLTNEYSDSSIGKIITRVNWVKMSDDRPTQQIMNKFWSFERNILLNFLCSESEKYRNFMVLARKKSQNYGNPYTWNIFMPIFEFVGRFFFQNDVYKLQEDFSQCGMRVFLDNGLGSYKAFRILQIWDKTEVI